jgi:hypothetical protein
MCNAFFLGTEMITSKPEKKKAIPAPGKKLSVREAMERTNKKFGKALAKLAK